MRRRLFNLATAVSLAAAALWVRGQWYRDTLYRLASPRTWSFGTTTAGIVVGVTRFSLPAAPGQPWRWVTIPATGPTLGAVHWSFAGFTWSGVEQVNPIGNPLLGRTDDFFMVPYWFCAASSALLPAWFLKRAVAGRRRRGLALRNACPTCGYDLRATPDHCPECGRTPGE